MTVYRVPYTFVPGTKAKATEVNSNFSTVVNLIEETNQNCSNLDLSNISNAGKNVIYNNSSHAKLLGEIIISSIPLSDSGLHLLDGTQLSTGGTYNAFITHIAGLVSTYSNMFCTEAEWQTSVNTYGVCGKFVYDSLNGTLRLPKITGFIEGTNDTTNIGNLVQAQYITDASSNSGTTEVQPQKIKVLYYIVVASTTKLNVVANLDNVTTDLNTKANKDLVNTTPAHSFYTSLHNSQIETVIETYQNSTSWYRKWSDGWIEQGGHASQGSDSAYQITFLVTMSNTNYQIIKTNNWLNSIAVTYEWINVWNKTTTSVTTCNSNNTTNGSGFDWYVCGY